MYILLAEKATQGARFNIIQVFTAPSEGEICKCHCLCVSVRSVLQLFHLLLHIHVCVPQPYWVATSAISFLSSMHSMHVN